ncbi:conjugal transfer protein TraN [Geoalkalibacter sp.]|uniref:conjugal transfer protein TraN n=1 Tax=Geoalkalibacter sp. TaxID=3041440 RepID=UPI00272DC7C0|nr:conjugal transfer protein TraN [Geoalkalibacter sp.]
MRNLGILAVIVGVLLLASSGFCAYVNPRCPTDDAQFGAPAQGIVLVVEHNGRPILALFDAGTWILDTNTDGVFDPLSDPVYQFGQAGDLPVFGDFDGNGRKEIGVYRAGQWLLDTNNSGAYEDMVDDLRYFGQAGDLPVPGDFNGDGRTQLAVFRDGTWRIDMDGDGFWDPRIDLEVTGFGQSGDRPIAGDWNGLGFARIGVYRAGQWLLDLNANYHWDGAPQDQSWQGFGTSASFALPADWNGDGRIDPGIREGGRFVLDTTGDGLLTQGTCDPNELPQGEFDPNLLPSPDDGSGLCGADLNGDGVVALEEMDNCDLGICPIERAQCTGEGAGDPLCPQAGVLNTERDMCQLPAVTSCPQGYVLDGVLDLCLAPVLCPNGGLWNPQKDLCEKLVVFECPPGYLHTYDGGQDLCIKDVDCAPGVLNPQTDRCEMSYTPSCEEAGPGYVYSDARDRCEIPAQQKCPPGTLYNAAHKKCMVAVVMQCQTNLGYSFEEARQRCELRPPSCPEGYTYNTATNACEKFVAAPVEPSANATIEFSWWWCDTCSTEFLYTRLHEAVLASGGTGGSIVVSQPYQQCYDYDWGQECETRFRTYKLYQYNAGAGHPIHIYQNTAFVGTISPGGTFAFRCEDNASAWCRSGLYIDGVFRARKAGGKPWVYWRTTKACAEQVWVPASKDFPGHYRCVNLNNNEVTCPDGYSEIIAPDGYKSCLKTQTAAASCPSGSLDPTLDLCHHTPTLACPVAGTIYDQLIAHCVADPCPGELDANLDVCIQTKTKSCGGMIFDAAADQCYFAPVCEQGLYSEKDNQCQAVTGYNCGLMNFNPERRLCEDSGQCAEDAAFAGPKVFSVSETLDQCVNPAQHKCDGGYAYHGPPVRMCEAIVQCPGGGTYNLATKTCGGGEPLICPLGDYPCGAIAQSNDVFLRCPEGSGSQYNSASRKCEKPEIVLSGRVFQAGFYDLFINPAHPNRLYTTFYRGDPNRGDNSYLEFNLVNGQVQISSRMWQDRRWEAQSSGNRINWYYQSIFWIKRSIFLGATDFSLDGGAISISGPRIVRDSYLDVRPNGNRLDFFNVGFVGSISFDVVTRVFDPLTTQEKYCSPHPCQTELVDENYEPDMAAFRNDGTLDPETGQCIGEIFIFNGAPKYCLRPGVKTSFFNCCSSNEANWLFFQKVCDQNSIETAHARDNEAAVYIGDFCKTKWPVIGCVQRAAMYCVFSGKLAKETHLQGRRQLKNFAPDGDWGSAEAPNCRGFSPVEFSVLDFGAMDLSSVYGEMVPTIPINTLQQRAGEAAERFPVR